MSVDLAVFIFGAILLSIGILGGGFELKEISVPKVGPIARGLAAVAGVVFIAMGISFARPQVAQAPTVASAPAEPAQRPLPTETPVRLVSAPVAPTPVPPTPVPPTPIPPTPIPQRPTAVIPPSARAGSAYPADVVQNFMNSCVATGGTQPLCRCAIEHMQDTFSLEEFSRIEVRASLGEPVPLDMLDIFADCRVRAR